MVRPTRDSPYLSSRHSSAPIVALHTGTVAKIVALSRQWTRPTTRTLLLTAHPNSEVCFRCLKESWGNGRELEKQCALWLQAGLCVEMAEAKQQRSLRNGLICRASPAKAADHTRDSARSMTNQDSSSRRPFPGQCHHKFRSRMLQNTSLTNQILIAELFLQSKQHFQQQTTKRSGQLQYCCEEGR